MSGCSQHGSTPEEQLRAGNFCFGQWADSSPVFIIDFGFATPIPLSCLAEPTLFCGTPDYASENALLARSPYSCKDDLEALVYTLLDLALCGEAFLHLLRQLHIQGQGHAAAGCEFSNCVS